MRPISETYREDVSKHSDDVLSFIMRWRELHDANASLSLRLQPITLKFIEREMAYAKEAQNRPPKPNKRRCLEKFDQFQERFSECLYPTLSAEFEAARLASDLSKKGVDPQASYQAYRDLVRLPAKPWLQYINHAEQCLNELFEHRDYSLYFLLQCSNSRRGRLKEAFKKFPRPYEPNWTILPVDSTEHDSEILLKLWSYLDKKKVDVNTTFLLKAKGTYTDAVSASIRVERQLRERWSDLNENSNNTDAVYQTNAALEIATRKLYIVDNFGREKSPNYDEVRVLFCEKFPVVELRLKRLSRYAEKYQLPNPSKRVNHLAGLPIVEEVERAMKRAHQSALDANVKQAYREIIDIIDASRKVDGEFLSNDHEGNLLALQSFHEIAVQIREAYRLGWSRIGQKSYLRNSDLVSFINSEKNVASHILPLPTESRVYILNRVRFAKRALSDFEKLYRYRRRLFTILFAAALEERNKLIHDSEVRYFRRNEYLFSIFFKYLLLNLRLRLSMPPRAIARWVGGLSDWSETIQNGHQLSSDNLEILFANGPIAFGDSVFSRCQFST